MEVVDANKKQRPGLIHPLYTTDFRLSEAGANIIDRRSTTKRYILRFSRVFSYTWDFPSQECRLSAQNAVAGCHTTTLNRGCPGIFSETSTL
jgi:hypothetical protein